MTVTAWLTWHGVPAAAAQEWSTVESGGRVEARRGGNLLLAWQGVPLEKPAGGAKLAGSAFLHPLRTPSGFEWTTIQPADHLHHFGLWWPWKYIEVGGKQYNCWEIQEGQGAHIARSVKQLASPPESPEWEFKNEVVVHDTTPTSPATATTATVILETARVALGMRGADTVLLDIALRQKAARGAVTIVNYRYSGFSWRGPASWTKDNSRMLTSGGHGRDDANGKPARWVVVNGPTPKGSAAVLLMSAAAELAGAPEQLRVWDFKMGNGTPFVNFNPVMAKSQPLDDAHPAVANRKYRIVAADHEIDATAAEAEWRQWLNK